MSQHNLPFPNPVNNPDLLSDVPPPSNSYVTWPTSITSNASPIMDQVSPTPPPRNRTNSTSETGNKTEDSAKSSPHSAEDKESSPSTAETFVVSSEEEGMGLQEVITLPAAQQEEMIDPQACANPMEGHFNPSAMMGQEGASSLQHQQHVFQQQQQQQQLQQQMVHQQTRGVLQGSQFSPSSISNSINIPRRWAEWPWPSLSNQLEMVERIFDQLHHDHTYTTDVRRIIAQDPTYLHRDTLFPDVRIDTNGRVREVNPLFNLYSSRSPQNVLFDPRSFNLREEQVQHYARAWSRRHPGRSIPCPLWNTSSCPLSGLHPLPTAPGILHIHACSTCWFHGSNFVEGINFVFSHKSRHCPRN